MRAPWGRTRWRSRLPTMMALFIGWRRGHSLESLGKAATESVSHRHQRDLHPFRRRRADRHLGDERHAGRDGLLRAAAAEPQLLLRHRLRHLRPSSRSASAVRGPSSARSASASWASPSNMGLNPAIAAGAIISGAYFGDTCSPLSDSANLAAAAVGRRPLPASPGDPADLVGGPRHLAGDLLHAGPAGRLRRDRQDRRHHGARSTSPSGCSCRWSWSSCSPLFKVPPFTAIFLGAIAGGRACRDRGAGARVRYADAGGNCPRGWRCSRASGSRSPAGTSRVPASPRWTCWRRAAAWTAC